MTLSPLNPALAATFAPPVMEARRWLEGVAFPPGRPLINVSQAAPVEPPPRALRAAIAQAALDDPQAHLYGPVLGLEGLARVTALGLPTYALGGADAETAGRLTGSGVCGLAAVQAISDAFGA